MIAYLPMMAAAAHQIGETLSALRFRNADTETVARAVGTWFQPPIKTHQATLKRAYEAFATYYKDGKVNQAALAGLIHFRSGDYDETAKDVPVAKPVEYVCQHCHERYESRLVGASVRMPYAFCSPSCEETFVRQRGMPKVVAEIPLGNWETCNLTQVLPDGFDWKKEQLELQKEVASRSQRNPRFDPPRPGDDTSADIKMSQIACDAAVAARAKDKRDELLFKLDQQLCGLIHNMFHLIVGYCITTRSPSSQHEALQMENSARQAVETLLAVFKSD